MRLSFAIFLIFVFAAASNAQWSQIPAPKFEALQSAGGVVWGYGRQSVYVSDDQGASWRRADPQPLAPPKSYLVELTVLDADKAHSIYIFNSVLHFGYTTDRGLSWSDITLDGASFPDPLATSLLGGNAFVYFGKKSGSFCYISGLAQQRRKLHKTTDLGATWTSQDIADIPDFYNVVFSTSGDMFGITNDGAAEITKTYKSTDEGANWTLQSVVQGVAEPLSFVIDSCNAKMLSFYSNARYQITPTDTFEVCDVYVSPDEGVHWQSRLNYRFKESMGSTVHEDSVADYLAVSKNALYAAHVSGVLRTTNHGKSWQNIGGPHVLDEVQGLTAIDDNIIFALDGASKLWRTQNAGGFPITPTTLSFAPDTLFRGDTLSTCDSVVHTQLFTITDGTICPIPLILSQRISGLGAANYAIVDSLPPDWVGPDTARIAFRAAMANASGASYEIQLDNGATITIPLAGIVKRGEDVVVRLRTATIRQDTIGAEIRVPIFIQRSRNISSIDLTASFDTSLLDFTGAFDLTGNRIDLLKQLHFDSASLSVVSDTIGYITFRNFIGNAGCTDVQLNSLKLAPTKGITICSSDISAAATATICSDFSCGRNILAKFIRYGIQPKFTITPNPASEKMMITSLHTLGTANVEIVDVTGNRRIVTQEEVSSLHPAMIDISALPAGVYYVWVGGYNVGNVVVQK